MLKEYSLLDFQRRFNCNESCLQAIFEARWPRGFICPHCGHNDGYRLSKRRAIQCVSCRRQTSITAGTLFHKSKVPLVNWFWLIFLMSQDKGGISTMRAAKLLNMHYATVWFVMHKIREAMANRLEGRTLSGYVEIDEAFFGGKARGERGTTAGGKKRVCVMVERLSAGAGDAALQVLPAGNAEAYQNAVEACLEPMTHVRADGISKNSVLHGRVARLNMKPIPIKQGDGPLANADRVTSLVKRQLLGTYHQYCSRGHLQRFLNEYCYRFNRRYQWYQLASRLIIACALAAPVQYAAIS
jgi:ISXO2-like transposase domain/Transposase zinc-ribbon domain